MELLINSDQLWANSLIVGGELQSRGLSQSPLTARSKFPRFTPNAVAFASSSPITFVF